MWWARQVRPKLCRLLLEFKQNLNRIHCLPVKVISLSESAAEKFKVEIWGQSNKCHHSCVLLPYFWHRIRKLRFFLAAFFQLSIHILKVFSNKRHLSWGLLNSCLLLGYLSLDVIVCQVKTWQRCHTPCVIGKQHEQPDFKVWARVMLQ